MKKNLSNAEVLHALLGPEGASLPLDRRLAQLEALRADPETSQQVDAALLERVHMLCRGLQTAQHQVGQLQVIVDKLTALPWYPAVVVAPSATTATRAFWSGRETASASWACATICRPSRWFPVTKSISATN
ncbi:MAG: hypothetical protein M5U12_23800 [Verrucomicrobia bacterium]|nr:hypothetical protein [Verrucomicrobiota bacterium]